MLTEPILELTDAPKPDERPIIKVIGVGGGGCNAVDYMYQQGIANVTFMVCNTDHQALRMCSVPTQLLLGEGLGAGTKVDVGRAIGEQHREDIRQYLEDGTRMVFVATGLGGGTGTAVAPIVAQIAREMGILTVGVVTLPFAYESDQRIEAALDGLEEMRKQVDALIVINNERVITVYSELTRDDALRRVDDVLCVAVRSITEIVTRSLKQNADFNDVRTTLENSGLAVMNQVRISGEKRLYRALTDIVNSPLLNNRKVYDAQRLLFVVRYPANNEHTILISELEELKEFMKHFNGRNISCKHSFGHDSELQDEICVTLLAAGFSHEYQTTVAEAQDEDPLNEDPVAAAQREARYNHYYGSEQRQNKAEPFLFTQMEDLDNSELIGMLSKQPAYKRTIMSNITLKRNFATAENTAIQQALEKRNAQQDIPADVINLTIDKGETYQLH